MKVSNWDNGLTAEQQAEMDAKWEELLAQVKKIDPKLYKKIQDESLELVKVGQQETYAVMIRICLLGE
mgnify:CR=1 FL=1